MTQKGRGRLSKGPQPCEALQLSELSAPEELAGLPAELQGSPVALPHPSPKEGQRLWVRDGPESPTEAGDWVGAVFLQRCKAPWEGESEVAFMTSPPLDPPPGAPALGWAWQVLTP